MADYEVIDQLQKFPEQVSLLALLMNFAEHQKVLIKTLNEAYVPVETSVEHLERMAERFFAINQISFNKNDLPPEGAAHYKVLHLIVKCEGYYMKRIMLDGVSGVNICPLSTLQRMEIGTERNRPNNVCVRAFDGIKRDTIGEIDLILTIGPVDFEVTFQVLYMDTSYNFLLGRLWIPATGAVPSTLHQMVKFEHEDQDIVVHGEDEQSIYRDPSVPCLEATEGSEHIVYQAFEIVVADQYEEGNLCPQPFLFNASIMVAKEMIRHDFKPGKGLGKSLQGIAELITLPASEKFFGVGFRPTPANIRWANRKNDGWVLPQPVPHLYRIFVKPKYHEEEEDEAFTTEGIEEICGIMRKILYETHMVQLGEGSSTAESHAIWSEECWGNLCEGMTAIFHDMMHQEIEVYVDDVIIKSKTQDDHVRDLKKFFEGLRKYDLKLNPAKCAFGVPSGKLLGFIVSRRGIELDPTTIKSIQDLPPPKTKKDVMSLLGRLNYISWFIAQLTSTCEPMFKLLKKDAAVKWTDECQEAFDKIKEYLSNPPVLVPPELGRPLFLYLTVLENSFGCVLGQHDVTGKREQAIYYLSKKFSNYEAKYTLLEITCCTLTWVAQKLRHYLQAYTTYLVTRLDSLKYIFQKPMLTGRLAKWQILLTEFDIVYVTRTTMKA
ncbi:uncharacterized protein [Nicotiana sylvestris]|uniref:uncharacterized protein n=1 Tax=Nicotiana sylvestris TaxID=4096 RepID=UPI00388C92CA